MTRWVDMKDRHPSEKRVYKVKDATGPHRYPLYWDGESWWTLGAMMNMTSIITAWREEIEE